MKSRVIVAIAALAIAGLAPTQGGASADADGDGTSDVRIRVDALGSVPDSPLQSTTIVGRGELPPIGDADLAALEASAEGMPTTVDELRALIAFEAVRDEIRQKYPEIYTASAVSQEPDHDFDLVFTQSPPSSVDEALSGLTSRVKVSVGAPMNAIALMEFQANLLELMPKLGMNPTRTTIVSSPLSTALGVVTATPGRQMTEKEAEASLAAGLAGAGDAPTIFVNFSPDEAENVPYFTAHGGMPLSGCNTAFGAKRNSNGNKGVLGAGHCGDNPYYASTGVQLNSAVAQQAGIDSQFNGVPSPHTADNQFKSDVNVFSNVTSVSDPPYGLTIWTYGAANQRQIGVVTNANTCYDAGSVTYCSVAKTTANAGPGDSGGPCFSYTTARGIVSGGNPGVTTNCTLSSAIGPITILTS